MDSRKIKTPITYRPSQFERWLSLLVTLVVILLFGSALSDDEVMRSAHPGIFIGFVLLVGFGWLSLQNMFYNKFIFWDHGLEVYLDGVHRFVRWEDMERFGAKKRGKSTKRGIYVSRFEREEISWFARIFSYDKNFIALNRIVPIPRVNYFNYRLDVERFKFTPLGQDLLHFAPHLFDDEKAKHNG